MISQAELKQLLSLDIPTGVFRWAVAWRGGVKPGQLAGAVCTDGYRQISVKGKLYSAHRLVWLWEYGVMPTMQVDHINGVKDDNRPENLRLATQSQNMANTGLRRNNSSGYKGVSFEKPTGKWRARIYIDGKRADLGRFESADEAGRAYAETAKAVHGEFASGLA